MLLQAGDMFLDRVFLRLAVTVLAAVVLPGAPALGWSKELLATLLPTGTLPIRSPRKDRLRTFLLGIEQHRGAGSHAGLPIEVHCVTGVTISISA